MMNNARLSVGLEGLSLAERAWQDAIEYARERRQGRAPGAPAGEMSPIIEHPDVRRMLLTMKSLVEAMRAIIYVTAEGIDLAAHHPDPAVREDKGELVDLLIPVAKAWSTDMGIEVTSLAIQVYGGMGYIEESGVPQHYRDARITSIYEGTNGIQAMDLVGRKLPMRGGAALTDLLGTIAALDAELEKAGDELATVRTNLADAVATVADATSWLMEHGLADPRDALAGASPYLRMFSLVAAGWLMARQALAAHEALADGAADGDRAFLEAKVVTARFFAENLLPAVQGLRGAVTAGHGDLFAIAPEVLAG
jgi:hypothetical protein